jgi:hypothetical protein
MTTRAGFAGILTGLLSTLIIYPFFIARPDAFLQNGSAGSTEYIWIAPLVIALLMIIGGFWAGSVEPLYSSVAPYGAGRTDRRVGRNDHLLFMGCGNSRLGSLGFTA